jgi:hypothetical protein
MVWRITARPVGKGLDLEGSHLHIGDLPPALRDIARGFDEPVVIEIAGSGAPWVRVFNTKIVTATSVPRGGDAPS